MGRGPAEAESVSEGRETWSAASPSSKWHSTPDPGVRTSGAQGSSGQ